VYKVKSDDVEPKFASQGLDAICVRTKLKLLLLSNISPSNALRFILFQVNEVLFAFFVEVVVLNTNVAQGMISILYNTLENNIK
jgi:hypothetical protein